jgi:hypothetical protein
MKLPLPAALLTGVQIDEALVHPSQLCAGTVISPICYESPRSHVGLRLVLTLLRFGTSTLYQIGAIMDEAELALGVNVVE